MTTLNAFFHPRLARILRGRAEEPTSTPTTRPTGSPAPASGHRHGAPAPEVSPRTSPALHRPRHPAWLDTGGRVDRLRRNERHGDEKE